MHSLSSFISAQRAVADKEQDIGIKYGMTKVLDALEGIAPSFVAPETKSGKWMSIPQAVEELGVCDATIRRWKREGLIPFRQMAGKSGRVQVFIE